MAASMVAEGPVDRKAFRKRRTTWHSPAWRTASSSDSDELKRRLLGEEVVRDA